MKKKVGKRRGPGRPALGDAARVLISFRVQPEVLDRLKVEARRQGIGYQVLMHAILVEGIS